MRTTIDITDELMRKAKRRAADEGVSMRELMESALRVYLRRQPTKQTYTLRWSGDAGPLLPGVDLDDRDALFDVMDGRR